MQYTRRYFILQKGADNETNHTCKCITETAGIVIPGRDSFCGKAQPGRRKDNRQAVEELSLLKCRDIYAQTTGDVAVIGADTVVAAEGRILGKPADKEEAVSMLTMLQGKQHEVYTGVTVMVREEGKENIRTFHEKTEVYFYPMTEEEIRGYVETEEPMDKAGAYGIQGKSAVFIREIRGDYNTVVGLPLARLYQECRKMGLEIKEW